MCVVLLNIHGWWICSGGLLPRVIHVIRNSETSPDKRGDGTVVYEVKVAFGFKNSQACLYPNAGARAIRLRARGPHLLPLAKQAIVVTWKPLHRRR